MKEIKVYRNVKCSNCGTIHPETRCICECGSLKFEFVDELNGKEEVVDQVIEKNKDDAKKEVVEDEKKNDELNEKEEVVEEKIIKEKEEKKNKLNEKK